MSVRLAQWCTLSSMLPTGWCTSELRSVGQGRAGHRGEPGLGKEMVLAFAAAGADVVISSRKLDACEELAEQVRSDTGRRALAVAAHAGRWDDIDALADAAYGEFGRVDVLVNNAGMAPLYPKLSECSEDLFDKVIGVNLKGPFRLGSADRRADG